MIDIISPLIKEFLPFAQKHMGFSDPPRLFLRGDATNAQKPLGKTAFYDPQQKSITIYIMGRHPKDVMRSLSHELVHHTQNCRGDFKDVGEMGEGYAQNDEHLREMEREAYETGNMCFRDWEDSIKQTIYFEHLQKGEKKMSIKDWKNGELTTILSEAFGFKFNPNALNEGADKNTGMTGVKGDDDDDTYMGHVKEETGETVTEEEEILETGAKDTGASKGDDSKTHKGEKDYTTKKDDELKDTEDAGARGEKKGDKAYVNEDSGWEEKEHDEHNAWNDEDHIEAIEKHLRALKHDRDYEEDHEDLEEGGAAARTGNEEKDIGRDRMRDDRVHETQDGALKEAIRKVLSKYIKD